jgi:hypothetical protein
MFVPSILQKISLADGQAPSDNSGARATASERVPAILNRPTRNFDLQYAAMVLKLLRRKKGHLAQVVPLASYSLAERSTAILEIKSNF